MRSTVPWGAGRSALHIGRREGDAVWHRRSDRRIPRRETVVNLNRIACAQRRSVQRLARPSRKSQVHELRADAVKVRRPRASGVGAKRRTLYGVEHSATLVCVMAGALDDGHTPNNARRSAASQVSTMRARTWSRRGHDHVPLWRRIPAAKRHRVCCTTDTQAVA